MKPPTIPILRTGTALALTALWLTACGTWQSTKETSADVARAIFVAKVKQMNLAIDGRAELNLDERGVSLPVALRVYQLKDAKAYSTATYAQLLNDTSPGLEADELNRTDLTLGPNGTVALSAPMDDDAQYVGVAAFFRDPTNAEWQLVIPKSRWKETDLVKISAIGNTLELEGRSR